jgi:hypothetical protein
MERDHVDTGGSGWRTLFEERHGRGAYERLLADFRRPCVTFAAIAKRLRVTRERVRQWQMTLLPDAPRGHERQRLCATYQRKRQLLQDPLFRAFYRHARAHVTSARIEPVTATDGFRRRIVQIDRRIVALRSVRPSAPAVRANAIDDPAAKAGEDTAAQHDPSVVPSTAPEYRLATYRGAADFVYYRLTADEYLLMPAHHLHAREARFVDASGSRYSEFKNTFAALEAGAVRDHASAAECRC